MSQSGYIILIDISYRETFEKIIECLSMGRVRSLDVSSDEKTAYDEILKEAKQ